MKRLLKHKKIINWKLYLENSISDFNRYAKNKIEFYHVKTNNGNNLKTIHFREAEYYFKTYRDALNFVSGLNVYEQF